MKKVKVNIPDVWSPEKAQATIDEQATKERVPSWIWQQALAVHIDAAKYPNVPPYGLRVLRNAAIRTRLAELCAANGYVMPSDSTFWQRVIRHNKAEQNTQQDQLNQSDNNQSGE